jgi:RimJ/RimL family protein N-acetyltransferase
MLSGDRVVLRAIQREDVPRLYELFEDLETKYLLDNDPAKAESLAAAEAEFEDRLEEKNSNTAFFAIEADGEVIGSGGLHQIDHFRRLCEVGIGLGRDYWGRGYGQDTVRTLVDYAFTHLNMNKVCLEVLADDERAVGAYKKAGFVEEGRLRQQAWVNGRYEDTMMMGILRTEWEELYKEQQR